MGIQSSSKKLRILFYQNSPHQDEVVSEGVHVKELLDNLARLGHTIVYADGQYHVIEAPSQAEAEINRQPSSLRSHWAKTKAL